MKAILSVAALSLLVCLPARAANPWRDLFDLDALPALQTGVRTYQVGSTDPSGGNADFGFVVRREGGTRVLADLRGPGIVRRIWSANPSGRIRIVVDGAAMPIVDAPFQDLFTNAVPGFQPPVAGKSSGGWYSYVPIAYRQSCVITVEGGEPFYYQVTYQTVPLAEVDEALTNADDTLPTQAVAAWMQTGVAAPDKRDVTLPTRSIDLAPQQKWGQPVVGPGTITSLTFRFAPGTTFAELRQTVLRISFDGEKAPPVEAPLADFLGLGFGNVSWKSLPIVADYRRGTVRFRMPFLRKARVELENTGPAPVRITFEGTARPGVPDGDWGYFHASFNTAVNVAGQDYRFAAIKGRGQVVGVTQSMRGIGALGFLEGDEKIFVDGETKPSIVGTGTEDFYNCGWYFLTGPVNVALHGASRRTDNEVAAWRFQIPDAVPFSSAIDYRMEHGGTNNAPGTEYASVLYWYGAPGATASVRPLARGAALLPKPYMLPTRGIVEAEAQPWSSAGLSVRKQQWQEVSPYRGGGRVLLSGASGASAYTSVTARFTDAYDVALYISGGAAASAAHLQIDGKRVGDRFAVAAGALPVKRLQLGPVGLTAGRHRLSLVLDSGKSVGLDGYRLLPRSPLVRSFAVLGPFPVKPETGVNTPLPPDGRAPLLGQSYRVEGKEYQWTLLNAPAGTLDLGSTLTPNTNVVAYASFAVMSATAQDVKLYAGSDDGLKVWVNGAAVWTNKLSRGIVIDEDEIPVRLKAGWNTVLMKIDQGGGDWGVTARLPVTGQALKFAAVAPEGR